MTQIIDANGRDIIPGNTVVWTRSWRGNVPHNQIRARVHHIKLLPPEWPGGPVRTLICLRWEQQVTNLYVKRCHGSETTGLYMVVEDQPRA